MAPLSEAAVFAVQAHDGMRRKQESLEILKNTDDINLLIVWLGDKLANMRSLCREFKEKGSAPTERASRLTLGITPPSPS